jgi:hypothetical protein
VINEKGFRTLRVKQHDKLSALSLYAKILGLTNTSKVDLSGPGGQPMQMDHRVATARARIESRLGEIARRQAAELPAPTERSIPLQNVLATCSAPFQLAANERT